MLKPRRSGKTGVEGKAKAAGSEEKAFLAVLAVPVGSVSVRHSSSARRISTHDSVRCFALAVIRPRSLERHLLGGTGCCPLPTRRRCDRPRSRTLYVEPVETKTLLPQSQALLSTQAPRSLCPRRPRHPRQFARSRRRDPDQPSLIIDYRRDVPPSAKATPASRANSTSPSRRLHPQGSRSGKRPFFDEPAHRAPARGLHRQRPAPERIPDLPLLAESLAAKVTHAALDVW